MTSINIIARNDCKLNVNVIGNYNVALTGVTGPYNIVLLRAKSSTYTGDFLKIQTHWDTRLEDKATRIKLWENYIKQAEAKGETELVEKLKKYLEETKVDPTPDYVHPDPSTGYCGEEADYSEYVNYVYLKYRQTWKCYVSSDVITSYAPGNIVKLVNDMFARMKQEHPTWTNLIDYIDSYSKFKFTNIDILETTNAFGYLLGIPSTGGVDYSETIPIFNGTPYLFLKCNKLKTELRYCWQTDPKLSSLNEDEKSKAMYSNVQRIISVSPNNNMINQPFSLGGGQFTANGNDLTDVEFSITGINGEKLEFASDLLWSFELTPLPEDDLSKIPGLLPPEMRGQPPADGQPAEGQPPDGSQMPAEQQQQPNEQAQQQNPDTQTQNGEQEQQIIKPSPNGLMKNGLPRVELIP